MRILLFRNQTLSHDNLEDFLQNQGPGGSVVCCDSGALALDIAEKCGINVAITHVDRDSIPLATGFLKELKESNPALHILAIVLPDHFDYLGDELENLVDDFITIPIDMGELRIRLRKSLRHSQLVTTQPQPATLFKQWETGLSPKELIALQLQHESPPLDYRVEIPESTVKGDDALDNDIMRGMSLEGDEEEPLNSAVQKQTDIKTEDCLTPDLPFEANREKVIELPLVSTREDPVQEDSAEITAQEGNSIDGDMAEDMTALIVAARNRGGYKDIELPKPGAQGADTLLEPESLTAGQYQPYPEKHIAYNSQGDNKTKKGLLTKVLSVFSAKESA